MEFNKPISRLFLFFCIILSLSTLSQAQVSASPAGSPAAGPFSPGDVAVVSKVCKVTRNPNHCIEFVLPYLTSSSTDAVSVMNSLIENAYNRIGKAITICEKAEEDPSTIREVHNALKRCIKAYHKSLDHLAKALAASSRKKIHKLEDVLGSAIQNVDHCDRSFIDNNIDSPMMEMDHTLVDIIGYALDISKTLPWPDRHHNKN